MLIVRGLCLDISDCFWLFYASKYNLHIKLTTQTLHSNLQEMERKEEIEKLYLKHLPELNYIFDRDNNESR